MQFGTKLNLRPFLRFSLTYLHSCLYRALPRPQKTPFCIELHLIQNITKHQQGKHQTTWISDILKSIWSVWPDLRSLDTGWAVPDMLIRKQEIFGFNPNLSMYLTLFLKKLLKFIYCWLQRKQSCLPLDFNGDQFRRAKRRK